jgi:hypothetical protein
MSQLYHQSPTEDMCRNVEVEMISCTTDVAPPGSKLKYESPDINKLKALETSFGLPTEQLFPASLCNLDLSFPICTDDVGSTSNEPDKRQ